MFGDYGFDNGYFAQQNNPYQPQMQNQNYGYQNQNAARQRQPQNFNFQQQAQVFQQPFEFPRISGFDEIKNIHVWLVKFIEKGKKRTLTACSSGNDGYMGMGTPTNDRRSRRAGTTYEQLSKNVAKRA